jgi:uncharacterized protein (DUF433 family)
MRTDWKKYIASDPNIMLGKPILKGTRITVELILDKLAEGEDVEQILESHPQLTRKSIYACIAYAQDSIRNETAFALN